MVNVGYGNNVWKSILGHGSESAHLVFLEESFFSGVELQLLTIPKAKYPCSNLRIFTDNSEIMDYSPLLDKTRLHVLEFCRFDVCKLRSFRGKVW